MNRSTTHPFKRIVMSSMLGIGAFALVFATPMTAIADSFDDQIAALRTEIAGYQAEASRLAQEANTLANKIAIINSQKQAIQTQIDLSQARYDQLVADIAQTEKDIEDQKDLLGKVIAKLYVDGQTTTLEMFASSSSIGDFMDKQTYQGSIRNRLNGSIKQIKSLQEQLNAQKKQTESVLADQKSQREALAAQEAEQQALLAATQGQEANYQSLIGQRESDINRLQREQAAQQAAIQRYLNSTGASVVAGDPGRGGYPNDLASAPINSIVDEWGMYNRQCVSYTAWKVYQKNGYMPHGRGQGHAYQWPSTYSQYAQGSSPRVSSVVVWDQSQIGGGYGHVAWVEAVNPDGSIWVSQYNFGTPGSYSEMLVDAAEASSLWYIYF